MKVLKRGGEIEQFDKEKFLHSLKKAGFSDGEINKTLKIIEGDLYDGITTDELYDKSLEILKESDQVEPIVKYSLKKAILELGPSGFPFEHLISKIYEEYGYKTKTGVMIKGKCIEHEVDILAYNDVDLIVMEAKFHNDPNLKSDTKVALYVKARFDDLFGSTIKIGGKKRQINKAVLITNTSFTDNSKKYVNCVGTFEMISWSYPQKGGLLKMIEERKIHPITSIPTLSKSEKSALLDRGCVFCRDLLKKPQYLAEANIKGIKRDEILKIANLICKDKN